MAETAEQTAFDVVIVGGGPVGLWLAREIRLHGCSVLVLERNAARRVQSRAGNLQPRSLEILSMRGVVDRFLGQTRMTPTGHFASLSPRLKLHDVPSHFKQIAWLPQSETERILEELALDLGVVIRRGHEVAELTELPDAVAVTAQTADGPQAVTARYVVGCDGARSFVRKAAGIAFLGEDADNTCFLADVKLSNPPAEVPLDVFNDEGVAQILQWPNGDYRIIRVDTRHRETAAAEPVTLDEIRESMGRILADDLGIADVLWSSRVPSHARLAERYVSGRYILAGDAAHIHPPHGGRGMNVGLDDATNLGWKLAAVCNCWAGARSLLESYDRERRPVGQDLLDATVAQDVIASEPGRRGGVLRSLMSRMLEIPEVNHQLACESANLSVRYESDAAAHPCVGVRMPVPAEAERPAIEAAFHAGLPVLIDATSDQLLNGLTLENCQTIRVSPRAFGSDISALLVRPDGFVAWASAKANPASLQPECKAALRACFGH